MASLPCSPLGDLSAQASLVTWQGTHMREQFSSWMAPRQAPGFPRPSTEAPDGLQPTPASPAGARVPESAVHGALIRDGRCQTLHQAAKLHSPHLLRARNPAGIGASAVAGPPCAQPFHQAGGGAAWADRGQELRWRRLPGQRWGQ